MNSTKLLREHNLKATPQRMGILAIMHEFGHISIDNLYKEIKKEFDSISLATLYKNIHLMLDESLIKEVKISQHKSLYEIKKAPHAHQICPVCHSVHDSAIDETLFSKSIGTAKEHIHAYEVHFIAPCDSCA